MTNHMDNDISNRNLQVVHGRVAAQPLGREVEGFHVGAVLPQGPQRRHAPPTTSRSPSN